MRAFRFRLDPVLRLRRLELEGARVELARFEQARQRALAFCREWERRVEQAASELSERLERGLAAAACRSASAALSGLRERLAEAERSVEQAGHHIQEARSKVLQRQTNVRALERLRARALGEYRREAARLEQRELDEIAVQRAAQGSASA